MSELSPQQHSQLIAVLREGIAVVQMVIFKELRTIFTSRYPEKDNSFRAMLAGALINELFGQHNPDEKFTTFRRTNRTVIEQEFLALPEQLSSIQDTITDALRMQALCDNQEGGDSTAALKQAEELGILKKERDIPLPSTFMTSIRTLGEEHGLTIAPVQVTPEQDSLIN